MTFKEIIEAVQQKLRKEGIHETLIQLRTTNLPNFYKMDLKDSVAFYHKFRKDFITYLYDQRLTSEKIYENLGGGKVILEDIINEQKDKEEKKVKKYNSTEDVIEEGVMNG